MGAPLIVVLARLRLLALAGLFALQFAPATDAVAQALQPVPPLAARVNDLTGTLDTATQARLESTLEAFERRKGSQVVLLMLPTTAPEPIEAFAIRVADDWKIGRGKVDGQKVDDGVLLLVAKDDRRLRIEVGYGLEGAIPDARAKQVIENLITPRFRQGDFAGGVEAGLDAVMKLIDGEPLPAPSRGAQPADGGGDGGWLAMLLGAFFVALIVRQLLGRMLGSSLGAAVGGGMTWLAGSGPLLAAGAGVLIFVLLLAMASGGGMGQVGRHTWRSGPGGLPGGFGGGRRGGRGGFGGGGFRGGGGGFGGGGASGGW